MSRLSYFFLGLVTGALTLYTVINFHVVRARDGYHVVAKQPPRLSEAYVDVRTFGASDWAGRPQLTAALVEANQHQLMGESAAGAVEEGLRRLVPTWSDQPATR